MNCRPALVVYLWPGEAGTRRLWKPGGFEAADELRFARVR
jgi:hypothetical protein